jgi:photosystem II stability/assembly factor-like uncharacterized protein
MQHLQEVTFADSRNGVAVGLYGTILRSRNGGESWVHESAGTNAHLLVVDSDCMGDFISAGWFDTILMSAMSARE